MFSLFELLLDEIQSQLLHRHCHIFGTVYYCCLHLQLSLLANPREKSSSAKEPPKWIYILLNSSTIFLSDQLLNEKHNIVASYLFTCLLDC